VRRNKGRGEHHAGTERECTRIKEIFGVVKRRREYFCKSTIGKIE
jgi:hypothetical protein